MSNAYLNLKKKQEKEFNEFPMFFAFNNEQFANGMKKMGLNPDQLDMIYKMGSGGFYKRSDAKAFKELLERHTKEQDDAVKADLTGEGYIFDMFKYELANHEYGYTGDSEDTLDALGLSYEEVLKEGPLKTGFEKACFFCKAEA